MKIYFVTAATILALNLYSQPVMTVQPAVSDSLLKKVIEAHAIYQDISFFTTLRVKETYGTNSKQFRVSLENDSIIKERRKILNSLANNVKALPEDQAKATLLILEHYASKAQELKAKRKIVSLAQVNKISNVMNASNGIVTKTYSYTYANSESVRVVPDSYLNLDINFDNTDAADYIFYLIPQDWLYDHKFLYDCNASDFAGVDECAAILDRKAYPWNYTLGKRIKNIFSGSFVWMVLNTKLRKFIAKPAEIIINAGANSLTVNIH